MVFFVTSSEINSGKAPHIILLEYAKKYGDIFSYKIGQRWTVVLNGSAVIKEALLTKGVEFANRPDCFTCNIDRLFLHLSALFVINFLSTEDAKE